jgi:hypothetical protein
MRERARRSLRAAALTLVAGLLLPGAAHAQLQPAQSKPLKAVAAGFDVVVLRPLGLAALAIGATFFVPVAVLTAPGGKHPLQESLDIFVTEPAKHVFRRPLGEF